MSLCQKRWKTDFFFYNKNALIYYYYYPMHLLTRFYFSHCFFFYSLHLKPQHALDPPSLLIMVYLLHRKFCFSARRFVCCFFIFYFLRGEWCVILVLLLKRFISSQATATRQNCQDKVKTHMSSNRCSPRYKWSPKAWTDKMPCDKLDKRHRKLGQTPQ